MARLKRLVWRQNVWRKNINYEIFTILLFLDLVVVHFPRMLPSPYFFHWFYLSWYLIIIDWSMICLLTPLWWKLINQMINFEVKWIYDPFHFNLLALSLLLLVCRVVNQSNLKCLFVVSVFHCLTTSKDDVLTYCQKAMVETSFNDDNRKHP